MHAKHRGPYGRWRDVARLSLEDLQRMLSEQRKRLVELRLRVRQTDDPEKRDEWTRCLTACEELGGAIEIELHVTRLRAD